ncbi:MAG: glucoamylase family protein [Kiritimatiellia bacterium]
MKCTIYILAAALCATAVFARGASHADEARLDALERQAFQYFEDCLATNGLIQQRFGDPKLTSPQAEGLYLSALAAATERGWLKRPEAARHAALALSTCASLPRFNGFFAETYDLRTLKTHPANGGADTMATAGLMAGALLCEQYFDRDTPTETAIRETARRLFDEVEWDWMLRNNNNEILDSLAGKWSESEGFSAARIRGDGPLSGMLAYVLAIGSTSHPIPSSCWNEGWARYYRWESIDGADLAVSPPLFTHVYPQVWLDLKNRKDRHADYWRNAVRAARLNHQYSTETLYPGTALWGLSICEGPKGIDDYGYPPKQGHVDEDAVIAPAAAISAINWVPCESLALLAALETDHKETVWGEYGPKASFSPRHEWVSRDYLAADLGAMVCMIENHRSGLIRDLFGRHEIVRGAVERTGLLGILADFENAAGMEPYMVWESSSSAMQRIASDISREGQHALEVVCDGETATLAGHPSLKDFSAFKYLTLWISNGDSVEVALEDSRGKQTALQRESGKSAEDGWTFMSFALPDHGACDLSGVERILFTFHPQRSGGKLWTDGIFLTGAAPGAGPSEAQNLKAAVSRMPGEVVLSWDRPDEDAFAFHIKYSSRPIRDYRSFLKATPASPAPFKYTDASRTKMHITGLVPGETYHFAMQTENLARDLSGITAAPALALPRARIPDEFMVDNFDGGGLAWKALSDGTTAVQDSGNVLMGSGKSLKITCTAAGRKEGAACVYADTDFQDFSQHGFISVWVSGKTTIQIALANEKGETEFLPRQATSLADGWSPVYCSLADIRKLDRSTVSRILVYVQPDAGNENRAVWLDSLRLTRNRD